MATQPQARPRWYPSIPPDSPAWMREAFRQVCDRIYESRDDMGAKTITSKGTGILDIGTSVTTIAGTTITLPRTGNWIIIGTWRITVLSGDQAKIVTGLLQIGGTSHQLEARLVSPAAGLTLTLCNAWRITVSQGQKVSLAVQKEATAGGASTVDGQQSSITAIWGGG